MVKLFKDDHNSKSGFLDTVQKAFGFSGGTEGEQREARAMVSEVIAANVVMPVTAYKEKIAATTRAGDLADLVNQRFDDFANRADYDMEWMQAFKDVSDLVERGQWEVSTRAISGRVWSIIPEGSKTKSQKIISTRAVGYIHKFGAELDWTEEMIRYRKLGPMINAVEEFVEEYHLDRANRHYALLTGASSSTTSYQTTTGNTQVQNDIATFGAGAFTLFNGLKNTRRLPVTSPLIAYVAMAANARERVLQALSTLQQAVTGSPVALRYNIVPVFSWNANLPANATGDAFRVLLVAPGMKIQRAQEGGMEIMGPETDKRSYEHFITAWSWFGAGVFDTAQIITLRFAE